MELKTTEQELNEMVCLYESIRKNDHWQKNNSLLLLPELEWPKDHPSRAILAEYEANKASIPKQEPQPPQQPQQSLSSSVEERLLAGLEDLKTKLFDPLEVRKMKKFRQRLSEKDPITQTPRYGTKTAERVKQVLVLHQALVKAIWAAYGLEAAEAEDPSSLLDDDTTDDKVRGESNNINNNDDATSAPEFTLTTTSTNNSVVSLLKSAIDAQQEAIRQAQADRDREYQQQEEAKRAAEEEQRKQEEVQQQQEAAARAAEEADLAHRAEQVRQAQRQQQEAAAQAERDWIESIPIGPEGVKQQIQILKDDTASDPAAQKAALEALLVLFTQIAQHPEEINFRRIRRDHPQFHQDIGRHRGGREIFIAAGFKLVKIDDIPCFYSKEPNLETDMDAWSDWFDGIKSNLAVVKEMQ